MNIIHRKYVDAAEATLYALSMLLNWAIVLPTVLRFTFPSPVSFGGGCRGRSPAVSSSKIVVLTES